MAPPAPPWCRWPLANGGSNVGAATAAAGNGDDLIFFLQNYDVFLQVAGVFFKFRPRACTYCSEPDSCSLAYGTAPSGPIEYKQLLMDVSCVSDHSRGISLHMAGAYTFSFFEKRGRTVQPCPSRFGLSNYNIQGLQLHSPARGISLYFSSAQCAVT